jgi:Flp pilus assembly protein TadD
VKSELGGDGMPEEKKDDVYHLKPDETREPTLMDTFSPDRVEKFIMGELTLGQLYGITIEEAYSIAEMGYTMMEQGRLKDAQTVFQGLVISNPYDGYFHAVLGSIYQKLGIVDGAIEEYTLAIGLDPANVEAYVNRGELIMSKGNFTQAAADFRNAIELDPDGDNPVANRARALATILSTALSKAIEQQSK